MTARGCSELEGFTLGLLWQAGPCSPYDIRIFLVHSPSTQWSASAGSIYPVLRRLENRGFVAARAVRNHARRRRLYVITPSGLRALRAWVGPPLAPTAVTVSYDPLRSRARFLACLAPAARKKWASAAGESLAAVEKSVERWQEKFGTTAGDFAAWVTRSGELDCAARKQWLRELQQSLGRARRRRPMPLT